MRWDEEDLHKLAVAANDDGPVYLQHEDGSWAVVSSDGWPVGAETLYADMFAAIAIVSTEPIDVKPISVIDTEHRGTA